MSYSERVGLGSRLTVEREDMTVPTLALYNPEALGVGWVRGYRAALEKHASDVEVSDGEIGQSTKGKVS